MDYLFNSFGFKNQDHNYSVNTIIKKGCYHGTTIHTLVNSFILAENEDKIKLLKFIDSNGETLFTYLSQITTTELSNNDSTIKQLFQKIDSRSHLEYLNLKNTFGETALHNSVIYRNQSFLEYLVDKGVDGSIRDSRFLTALEIAKRLNLEDFQKILMRLERSGVTDYNPQIYQWGQIVSDGLNYEPQPVCFNDMESSVSQIAFGNNFSLLLTDTGKLYSWGYCSYGKLGHPIKKDLKLPTLIEALSKNNIKSIACGKDHSVALDDIGCVYVWGNGSSGRLGNGSFQVQQVPMILPYFDGIAIKNISCGQEHTLALAANGKVYSWGSAMFGRLGYQVLSGGFQSTPKLIESLLPSQQIACGNWHSSVLSKSGVVYTFGSNKSGRLGRKTQTEDSYLPAPVHIEKKVKKLVSGSNFNLCLTENNIVLGWGSNSYRIISHGASEAYTTEPVIIKHLLPYPISTIEVGDNHCMVLTDQGEVFSMGSGEFGQTGKNADDKLGPNFKKVCLIDNTNVFKVSAGSNSSMMCLSSGHQLLGMEMATLLIEPTNQQQQQQCKFEDLRLIINNNNNNYISAHCIIVASRCDLLDKLVRMEIKSPNQSNQIKLSQSQFINSTTSKDGIIYLNFPNIKFLSTLYCLIRFLYTDHTILKDNIEELGELAFLLKIERLSYICNFKSKTVKSLDLLPSSSLTDDFEKLENQEFIDHYHDIILQVHDSIEVPKSQFIVGSSGSDQLNNNNNNNNNNQLKSYKVLLYLRSNYFRLMFGGNFMEKDKKKIDIYEVSKDTLQLLLNYLYSNKVPEEPNDCIDLIVIADLHQLPRLKELCAGVIRQHINDENICYIYKIGSDYDVKPLIAWVEAKISNCKIPIKKLEFFNQLNESQQLKLLDRGKK